MFHTIQYKTSLRSFNYIISLTGLRAILCLLKAF